LGAGFFAGRAAADDDQIESVARGHQSPIDLAYDVRPYAGEL
jgi:hypothetical protein